MARTEIRHSPHLQNIIVKGALIRPTIHRSGHWYFTLTDGEASIDCVMFSRYAKSTIFDPSEGDEVLATGSIDIFVARGRMQLMVQHLRPLSGQGALETERRKLLSMLQAQGDLNRIPRELPSIPRHMALVTAPGSAALSDMLRIARERYDRLRITVFEVTVQGERAASSITSGLWKAAHFSENGCLGLEGEPPVDVIIVGRGGGSPEDLWAFNLEPVVEAILEMPVPVVSAVGHESDHLLSDLVADYRAATPSHAMELVVPERNRLEMRLDENRISLSRIVKRQVVEGKERVRARRKRLHTSLRIGHHEALQHWSDLRGKLLTASSATVYAETGRLSRILPTLTTAMYIQLSDYQKENAKRKQRISSLSTTILTRSRIRLERFQAILQAIDPIRILERGWVQVINPKSGTIIDKSTEAIRHDKLDLQFSDGRIRVSTNGEGAMDKDV